MLNLIKTVNMLKHEIQKLEFNPEIDIMSITARKKELINLLEIVENLLIEVENFGVKALIGE